MQASKIDFTLLEKPYFLEPIKVNRFDHRR